MRLGKQHKVAQALGSCQPCGRPGWNSWLLNLAWPSPGYSRHLGINPEREDFLSSFPSVFVTVPLLSNKQITLEKKRNKVKEYEYFICYHWIIFPKLFTNLLGQNNTQTISLPTKQIHTYKHKTEKCFHNNAICISLINSAGTFPMFIY